MLPFERLEKVLDYIEQKGMVKINELTDVFNVSKPTILRDLKELENQHLILRVHGGATSKRRKGTNFEPGNEVKEKEATEEKEAIANLAIDLIQSGETILLDSGTTTFMLAKKMLTKKNITVITNDIKIAMILSENHFIDLIVIGGQKRRGVYSLIGPFAENFLGQLNVDKVFLGADAIDFKKGLTNSNIEETNIKKAMIDVANEIILLADSSKFNKAVFARVEDIDILDRIITDEKLMEADIKMYRDKGITVQIAQTGIKIEG